MPNKIEALEVQRDKYGCWTHPEYDKFFGEREHIPNAEFQAWVNKNGLEWDYVLRDDSINDFEAESDGADFSKWQPEPPAGEGWFIGSIHDTEDGPVCVWFRQGAAQ